MQHKFLFRTTKTDKQFRKNTYMVSNMIVFGYEKQYILNNHQLLIGILPNEFSYFVAGILSARVSCLIIDIFYQRSNTKNLENVY